MENHANPAHPAEPRRRPTLSLCMIVKNEAQTLDRCLSTARPHVDEIVVVDTGSTDGTLEIARRYADVLHEIEWPNSFAAARNVSFDLGTGDYIMYLDGDEYIPDPVHWKRIHRALRIPNIAALQLPILNLLGEGHVLKADRMLQERVFRNDPRLRFTGRVHNQIGEALEAYVEESGHLVYPVEAEVMHTGYALDKAKMKDKYRPRLALLLDEYENPRSALYRAYYGYQLSVVYFVLERYEDAAELYREIEFDLLTPQNAFYTRLLAAQVNINLGRHEEALQHCNHMLALNPAEPIGYYAAGVALVGNGRTGDGMMMLLEALSVNEHAQGPVRFALNPATLYKCLESICAALGLDRDAALFRALKAEEQVDPALVKAIVNSLQRSITLAERRAVEV